MADLAVALLRCNTQGGLGGGGHEARLQELDTAVNQANAMMGRVVGGDDLRMVVAPEYFYSPIGEIGRNVQRPGPTALTRGQKHDIYGELKSISRRAGDTIIVAGSIYYTKARRGSRIGLNTCPILRGGKIIYKYYKKFDDGILGMGNADSDYVHKDTDPVFRVDGVSFGIEICGDHTDAGNNLASWLEAHDDPEIDVQIMISYSNAPVQQYMKSRANGYFVHCDLQGGDTAAALGVYQAGANGGFPIPGLATALDPAIRFDSGPNLKVAIYRLTGV